MMRKNEVVHVSSGYVSCYQVLSRIAGLIAGAGVVWERAGHSGAWFTAKTDGFLIVSSKVLEWLKIVPYIKTGSLSQSGFVRKNEVLTGIRITAEMVPEDKLRFHESFMLEEGALLKVKFD